MTDQHRLSTLGAGNDWGSELATDTGEPSDDECIAIADSTGERCTNPINRMNDTRFCSAHDRAEDPEVIDGVEIEGRVPDVRVVLRFFHQRRLRRPTSKTGVLRPT
jgi:hypothetical protein